MPEREVSGNVVVRPTISELALCAGVGWLSEGLRAGLAHLGFGHRTVCHVERDAYAAAVIVARMAEASLDQAPVWDNLESFDGRPWRGRVDCVSAGFPCQPWSAAGKQLGTADERWLWPSIVRVIADVGPRFVFLENVAALIAGGGLEHVISDLAALGFDAEWCVLSAEAVGASHRRERVFVLAYRPSRGFRELWQPSRRAGQFECGDEAVADATDGRERMRQRICAAVGAGCESRLEGCGEAMADSGSDEGRKRYESQLQRGWTGDAEQVGLGCGSVVYSRQHGRRLSEPVGGQDRGAVAGGTGEPVGHTDRQGLQGWDERGCGRADEWLAGEAGYPLFAPGPGADWSEVPEWLWPATTKSSVRQLADGGAVVLDESRADQLRCSGNGVVALQAATAFVELVRRAMNGAKP